MKSILSFIRRIFWQLQNNIRQIFKKKLNQQTAGINSTQLSEIILVLLLSLKSGSTLDQSIKNAIPARFQSVGLQGIESIQRTAKYLNSKDFYRLTMLLNQYHKNGSESTFQALQKFHDELCFHQTAEIKKRAEQATVKLTLLLMLSLISIILMIMAPVMIMLKR